MTQKPTVQPFDFSKLPKLSREQMVLEEALRLRYPWLFAEGALETLSQSIQKVFGQSVKIKSKGFQEQSLGSFLKESADQSLIAQVRRGSREVLWVRLDTSLVPELLASLLGETSSSERQKICDLEKGLLEFWVLKCLDWAKESLQDLEPWELQHWGLFEEGFSSSKEEQGCVFSFLLGMKGKSAYAWVYLSHPSIEGILLRESPWEEEPLGLSALETSLNRFGHLKAPVWTEIGRVSLNPEEQRALEVGDVVLFDESQAQVSSHGLSGKVLLRIGENEEEGLLAEVLDSGTVVSLKILEYYGG